MTKLPEIKNKKLLEESLTHRSYLNESKQRLSSNERLEFLGDSILSFVVSSYLFNNYQLFDEGKLTNLRSQLVNTKILAEMAKECNLGSMLFLSKGEIESGGRENPSLLADSFEAFIGALFLDQGIEVVQEFINSTVIPRADEFIKKNLLKDPKSRLQEYVQSKKQGSPLYKVALEEGPAHSKTFTVEAWVKEKLLGTGTGHSKQKAEENAALSALEKITS